MKWFFFIILALFCLGQLGRISWGGQPAFVYGYELFFFPLLWGGIIISRPQGLHGHTRLQNGSIILIGTLLATFVVSLFRYTPSQHLIAFAYLFRLIHYIVWIAYSDLLLKSWGITNRVLAVLVYCVIGILFASAMMQYWFYPNFGNISYLGWDPHMYRLVGVFFEPPIAAAVYGMCGLAVLMTYVKKKTPLLLAIGIVCGVMIFFTYSRTVMIAFSLTIGVFLMKEWPKAAGAGIALLVLFAILLPQSSNESINLFRVTSISSRQVDLMKGVAIATAHPVLGIGYNHIRVEKDRLSTEPLTEKFNPSHASASFHNSFLIILVCSGVIGLGAFLYWLYTLAQISPYSTYLVLFLAIASCADNVLLHPFILFLIPVLCRFVASTHHDGR